MEHNISYHPYKFQLSGMSRSKFTEGGGGGWRAPPQCCTGRKSPLLFELICSQSMRAIEKVGLNFWQLLFTKVVFLVLACHDFLCWFIDEWRMILDIWNIDKSQPPRSFGLLYVSLF